MYSEPIFLLIILYILAYSRMPAIVWHGSLFLLVLVFMSYSSLAWCLLGALWLPVAIPALRYRWLCVPLLHFFKKNLPDMSQTEREALEAGDVWWEGELFRGSPNWKLLHDFKVSPLSSDEQHFMDCQVETLCFMLDDWKIVSDKAQDLPPEIWAYLKKERFFGMIIPKEYGGLHFSASAHSAVITKIGTRSPTAAITVMVPNSLGPAELLLAYGTPQQKKYYLPRFATGEEIPCFALTATHSGSDAATMRDYGIVCRGEFNGQSIVGIRLYCNKRYITLAPIATLIGLAFKLYDPEHLLGSHENIGITLCLIPATHPGIETGKRHYPIQLPFMNGPVRANGAFIPMEWIIGGVEYAGLGWKMLMNCLSVGRSISLPAMSAASAQLSYRMTGAYASVRKQFNVPLAKFDGVEAHLARIAGLTYILNAMRQLTTAAVDHGIKPSLVSAIVKYHATEMFRQITNDAMDVHGGRGIQTGPRNYLASAYAGIPIGITVEGANILTRNLIIFGQGLMRCHPFLLKQMQLSKQKTPDVAAFDQLITAHAAHISYHVAHTLLHGLTGGVLIQPVISSSFKNYYRQLTRMSSALALVTDIAVVILGGKLKRKERLSARLGDVLSYLYMASAVLKQFHDRNEPLDERDSVAWSCDYCLYHIQEAFIDFFQNLPNKTLARLVKFWVFPFGRPYQKPTDDLEHRITQPMIDCSELRLKMTRDCYVGKTADDPSGRIEIAFAQVATFSEIERKFTNAIRSGTIAQHQNFEQQLEQAVAVLVLTASEARDYAQFAALCDDVLAVDEFETT